MPAAPSDPIRRTVEGMGYELVDVERLGGGLMRVTIDRVPGASYLTGPGETLTVEDCELVTRQLQRVLEVEAVDYHRLEVSSPGLDRPLKTPADWKRFAGHLVELQLRQAFQGRKRWAGELVEGSTAGVFDGDHWRLVLPPEGQPVTGPDTRKRPLSAKAKAKAEQAPRQVLDFELQDVREARLVPVVDFRKGRTAVAAQDDDAGEGPQQDDGGAVR